MTLTIAETIRNRLALCNSEVVGINAATREFAHYPLKVGECPVVAHSVQTINIPHNNDAVIAGSVTVLSVWYVALLDGDDDNADGVTGSIGSDLTTTLIDRVIDYHKRQYPALATSTLPRLAGVREVDIDISRQPPRDQHENYYLGFQASFSINFEFPV